MTNEELSHRLLSHDRWDWSKAIGARGMGVGYDGGERFTVVGFDDEPHGGPRVWFDMHPSFVMGPITLGLDTSAQRAHGFMLDLHAPATHGVLLGMVREASRGHGCSNDWTADEDVGRGLAVLLLHSWTMLDELSE